jgi:hypothetical protein
LFLWYTSNLAQVVVSQIGIKRTICSLLRFKKK